MIPVNAPKLSIIIPCYNEAARLPKYLPTALEYLDAKGWDYELLIVDDGSADGTVAVAEGIAAGNPRIHVHSYQPNQGKGAAIRYGALRARGELVLFSDADFAAPITELEKLVPHIRRDYQVVFGSRATKGSDIQVHQPWWRERAGRLMNLLIRRASGLNFSDTQCGFKLFTHEAAQGIFSNLTVNRWMFDVEALYLAKRLGYRAREVGVVWKDSGESRYKLTHTAATLRELAQIRWHWTMHQPKSPAREPDVRAQYSA